MFRKWGKEKSIDLFISVYKKENKPESGFIEFYNLKKTSRHENNKGISPIPIVLC